MTQTVELSCPECNAAFRADADLWDQRLMDGMPPMLCPECHARRDL